MSTVTFPTKYVGETKKLVFDFISLLASGETISTQVVAAAVWSGVDATPSSLISGSATASGTKVTQAVTDGVAGVIYKLTCTITTSAGQTLILIGYLPVLTDPV